MINFNRYNNNTPPVNNMAFVLTPRLGLDPKLLAQILNMSSGRCWSSDTYNPVPGVMEGVPSGNNYQGGFGTQLMAKVSLMSHYTLKDLRHFLSLHFGFHNNATFRHVFVVYVIMECNRSTHHMPYWCREMKNLTLNPNYFGKLYILCTRDKCVRLLCIANRGVEFGGGGGVS